jgi:hypothetical protein
MSTVFAALPFVAAVLRTIVVGSLMVDPGHKLDQRAVCNVIFATILAAADDSLARKP